MTPEKKSELLSNIEATADAVIEAVEQSRVYIRKTKRLTDTIALNNFNFQTEEIYVWVEILEYRLFIGLVYLDIATATTAFLNAKMRYEQLFALGQIVVVINEGYKKIYGFLTPAKDGSYRKKSRNNSFWAKEIKEIVQVHATQLNAD